jgi:hypothetical protein
VAAGATSGAAAGTASGAASGAAVGAAGSGGAQALKEDSSPTQNARANAIGATLELVCMGLTLFAALRLGNTRFYRCRRRRRRRGIGQEGGKGGPSCELLA